MKILLATDGQPASEGAIRMAMTLARDAGATVHVVRVVEPMPVFADAGGLSGLPIDFSAEMETRTASAAEHLERTLKGLGAPAAGWRWTVETGVTPFTIVQAAEREGSSLILLGTGRHELADRWLGSETALRVMQLAHVPVLAVPADGGARPRNALVAVDFSDFARRAIEAALLVCAPDAVLHLVHVVWLSPGENANFATGAWHEDLRRRLRDQLEAWAATIDGLSGHPTQLHVAAGPIADEIQKVADRAGVDLLVAGSHGRGFVGRAVFGSVSKNLIRRAATAVLVAPPPERAEEMRKIDFDETQIRGV